MTLYLDRQSIPLHAPCEWEYGTSYDSKNPILKRYGITDKQVIILINKDFSFLEGFIAKITGAPKLLKRPLDNLNSALWELVDGNRTLFQIAQIMEECYGEDIIPANHRCKASISRFMELNLIILK